jgi:uncharacterized repeat protein (TIGR02543 family)
MTGVASMAAPTPVAVRATPQAGSSASQPLFINRAWVTVSDTITVPTNSTYHQGAGVSLATFSAGYGGTIYNAETQALDYRTSPRAGILIVPDAGYRFAGWQHDAYRSLRGETIPAQSGILRYDTLTVYGNIELKAGFEPEQFRVSYHLHGGAVPNTASPNRTGYTIETPDILLAVPVKKGDPFTGWTGSNGDIPEMRVVIPYGSTGDRTYYANYLYSGREAGDTPTGMPVDDIWSIDDELYVRTSKENSIVRVYSTEGVLQKQQTIRLAGESKMKLVPGLYVVTLNNGAGKKVMIK